MGDDLDFGGGGFSAGGEATGPFFKFAEIIVGKASGSFTLEYPKLIMTLSPLMVAESKSEYQKHTILTALIQYFTAALSPIMNKVDVDHKKYPEPRRQELIDRYIELKGLASSCGIVKISADFQRAGDYNKYIYSTEHSVFANDEKKVVKSLRTPTVIPDPTMCKLECTVECSESAMLVGRDIARDNGYSRINCQAENTLNKALSLAFDLGIISINDCLRFESGDVTPEDNEREIERRSDIRRTSESDDSDLIEE